MTFDEAKLVLAAHGQEIIGDLFKPCTCGMKSLLIKRVGDSSEASFICPDALSSQPQFLPSSRLCGSCKARHAIGTALAVVTEPEGDEEQSLVPFFVSMVGQSYSS